MSLQHAYWLSVLLNFVVIAAVIIWAARKYLPGMFSARTAAIQKAMQEAQKASEEARRRLAEIESRLMKLDVEIGMMRDCRREGSRSRGSAHPGGGSGRCAEDAWNRRSRKSQQLPKPRAAN